MISIDGDNEEKEIKHTTDLAESPVAGPLFDEEGNLVGFNIQYVRRFGPNGIEPQTVAISGDVLALIVLGFDFLLSE